MPFFKMRRKMSCTLEIIIKVDFSIFFALILILHYANGSGIERKTGIAGERSNQKHAFFFFCILPSNKKSLYMEPNQCKKQGTFKYKLLKIRTVDK